MSNTAPTPLALSPLRRALADALRSWDGRSVLRAEAPAPPADALGWLEAQAGPHRAYWRGRGEAEARASVGAAAVVEGLTLEAVAAPLGRLLGALPAHARLTATARFDARAEGGAEWAPFGAVRFVLPRVEYRTDGRAASVAVHLAPGEAPDAARAAVEALRPSAAPATAELPLPFMRRDDPDRADWGRMLRWALGALSSAGPLQKVVLARRARFSFEEAVDPFALLRRLEAATPRCFHALVEAGGADRAPAAFLTATPERLFRLDGRTVETEAVAGTRPRAASDADDDRLRDELMGSEKDRREHGYVRERIAAALAPLTVSLDDDGDASAMTLARGRHLYTGFRGTLADGVGALDVLRALHPTPAVGGTPTPLALDAIDRLEPFDRGLYAGPVGWVGRDGAGREAAEVAVGIRSGLVEGRTLSLYSGAGIVVGSDPAAEWAEIEHKIGDFARVLGLTDRAES
ncbi:isochorismate synthase [Rubrivirga sp. S365]|uniref:isochorismate synthase n=1 Tax=Rubrivirga litoralis TaxID=3075598 RepID=A0ABU3BUK2_9BACT|nr:MULTISPECIES: isochorismate synthase [unclassified Rubrivirga]MDT0632963.1 isochorismate synthase [Rubrivirga sp. F394]MDT7856236.1 isochorismate synthase [Rubrivirga sp. S365]